MKLHFDKTEDGDIFVQVDGVNFTTKDYIRMIKEIKSEKKITATFGKTISPEERASVDSMLEEINKICEEGDVDINF